MPVAGDEYQSQWEIKHENSEMRIDVPDYLYIYDDEPK